MTREELEEAILVFQRLLDNNESREEIFQEYFKQYKVAFAVLGYSAAHPLMHLPLDDELKAKTGVSYFEPDFIVQRPNGLYEILDLKTPQEKLLRGIANRETFYAKINEYISQVINYSEYFDDRANREWVKQYLSLDIHKDPDVVLIVGRDTDVDKPILHKELRERSNRITFMTYDDVLTNLRFHYTSLYGRTDDLSGFSLHMIINVQKGSQTQRRYVYDCGILPSQNRFSVYLDNESLHFEVIDAVSTLHHIFARIPEELFISNEPFCVSAQFGNGEGLAIIQLRINNSIAAETVISGGLKVSPRLDADQYTLGQDLEGHNAYGTTFGEFELVLYNNIPSFEDRMRLLGYFFDRLNSGHYTKCIHFHEGACMYSSKMQGPPAGNVLRSQSQDLRPKVRHWPFQ